MLISQSVAPNVLPGLVKAVEKYILVYNSDEVLKHGSGTMAGNIISTGAKILAGAAGVALVNRLMDGEEIDNAEIDKITEAYTKSTTTSDKEQDTKTTRTQSVDFPRPSNQPKPSLDIPSKGESISLEPTWITVTTAKKGMQVLGVKVVPFRVKSTENLSAMLMSDSRLKFLNYLTTRLGRSITRVLFRLLQKTRIPTLKGDALKSGPISGDPKKDIIFAATKFRKNMFVCINQLDLKSTGIFSTPEGVRKLQTLGWASMIILDDVNRRATFCMKEFSGVCSVVPYNYMFASFGRDLNKAYEDLEDLKKSSGPFFNMRTNRKRAFAESNVVRATDKYLELIQEK